MAYTIFETFVGAGGAHIGFCENGFVSKYVNDIEPTCLETLTYNNGCNLKNTKPSFSL